jgi:two-component system, LytTR family, sensor kinase
MHIRRSRAYSVIVLFVLVGTMVRVMIFPEFGWRFHLTSFVVSLLVVPFLWETIGWFVRYLDDVLPFERNIPRRIVVQILASVAFFVSFAFVMREIFLLAIPAFIPESAAFLQFFTKPFVVLAYITNVFAVIAVNLGYIGHHFFSRWRVELVRSAELERERAQVQFDNLKNQLNPHFLFNSLTSLNSLIVDNPQLASDFLQQLSKVYRYVLQSNNDLVSLETELAFIKRYVHLLETRFQAGLKVDFTVSENALERKIAPVTLQILMENAIKHNITSAQKPLHIRVFDDGGYLSVANNVQRKTLVESSNKQGLQNLVQLYGYLDTRPVVVAEQNNVFCVKIPLL